jgi:hypothetical protein
MSYFFGDGFDLYASPADAIAGYWDANISNTSGASLNPGRFSNSRSMYLGTTLAFGKSSGVNDGVHHFVFAYMQNGNSSSSNLGHVFILYDGATAQCTFGIRGDGSIEFRSGTQTGTVLATYIGAPLLANVWYAFEVEVVVHNTNGSITIRKNGNPANDFFAGSLNTRTTTNNYANKITIGYYQGIGVTPYIDDFLWRSDAASVPWVGDIRCFTRRPASDVQAQLSRTSGAVNTVMWSGVGVYQSLSANQAEYMQFTAPYSGLLTGVTIPNAAGSGGGTGHIKTAIFSSVNNTIGTVLATSAELTTPPTGPMTFSFASPTYVSAGQTYWVGVINDSGNITMNVVNNPTTNIVLSGTSYAAWPINSPGGTPAGNNCPGITLIFTPQANADAVSDLYQDGTGTFVYSSTVGQNDLYAISAIGASPASIVGVVTRGFFQKSDAGSRNAAVQLKSGGVTVQGADTPLVATTFGWLARTDLVDPATASAWTVSGVNSANIGVKVTA